MADTKNAHSAEFINEMKERLSKEMERLEKDFDTKFPEYGDGEGENAVEIADYSNKLSVDSDLGKELRDVKNALKRIEEGTYGIDKYTGEPIDEARLRARPTSTSSVASKKTLTQEL